MCSCLVLLVNNVMVPKIEGKSKEKYEVLIRQVLGKVSKAMSLRYRCNMQLLSREGEELLAWLSKNAVR